MSSRSKWERLREREGRTMVMVSISRTFATMSGDRRRPHAADKTLRHGGALGMGGALCTVRCRRTSSTSETGERKRKKPYSVNSTKPETRFVVRRSIAIAGEGHTGCAGEKRATEVETRRATRPGEL